MDIVHEGMLIKSPPEKRLFKTKWRQRWFVLRHSGNLPDQYVLEYYTSSSRRKLRGSIDMDTCEQVDTGVTFDTPHHHKARYNYMFDIRTTKRIYYLVATSEQEMNQWVEIICKVCGLKMNGDEDYLPPSPKQTIATSSLSLKPSSSTASLQSSKKNSSSYIPISECMSGNLQSTSPLTFRHSHPSIIWDTYDEPRSSNDTYVVPKHPTKVNLYENTENFKHGQDDIQIIVPPLVKWDTYPGGCCVQRRHFTSERPNTGTSERVGPLPSESKSHAPIEFPSPNDSGFDTQRSSSPQDQCDSSPPPPRPPKPVTLKPNLSRYENVNLRIHPLSGPLKPSCSDSFVLIEGSSANSAPIEDIHYDFPKSQDEEDLDATVPLTLERSPGITSHSYSNAATSFVKSKEEIAQNYDQNTEISANGYLCMKGKEYPSEYTNMSTTKISTFLPMMTPPTVNRELKPQRSHSTKNSDIPHQTSLGNRKPLVKSFRKSWVGPCSAVEGDSPPPVPTRGVRKPTPILLQRSPQESPAPKDKVTSFYPRPSSGGGGKEVQYLDLDLDTEGVPNPPQRSPEKHSSTVYKTVDFLKTKAFNEERQIREASYKKNSQ